MAGKYDKDGEELEKKVEAFKKRVHSPEEEAKRQERWDRLEEIDAEAKAKKAKWDAMTPEERQAWVIENRVRPQAEADKIAREEGIARALQGRAQAVNAILDEENQSNNPPEAPEETPDTAPAEEAKSGAGPFGDIELQPGERIIQTGTNKYTLLLADGTPKETRQGPTKEEAHEAAVAFMKSRDVTKTDTPRARKQTEDVLLWEDGDDPTMIPEDMAERFRAVIQASDNPEETQARLVSAHTVSRLMGVEFADAYQNLEQYMDTYMGKHQTPDSFVNAVSESYKAASLSTKISSLGYQYMMTNDPAILAKIEALEAQMPDLETVKRSLPARALKSLAAFLPAQIESMTWGAATGLATAGVAAATASGVSAASGGTLSASIPISALAAFGIGMTAGTTERMRQIETGGMYRDLRRMQDPETKETIDPGLAMNIASIYGGLAGIVELFDVSNLTDSIPGLKKVGTEALQGAFSKAARKAGGVTARNTLAKKAVAKIAKEAASETGRRIEGVASEIIEEVTQEFLAIAAEDLARDVMNNIEADDPDTYFTPATKQEITQRLTDTMVESALGMGLMHGVKGLATTVLRSGATTSAAAEKASYQKLEAVDEKPVKNTVDLEELKAEATAKLDEGLYIQPRAIAEGEEYILKIGTKEALTEKGEGKRVGYVRYSIDQEGDAITIEGFEKGTPANAQRALVDHLGRQFPGWEINWEPQGSRAQAIRDMIVENNPRGREGGLQYYTTPTSLVENITTEHIRNRIQEARPGWKKDEVDISVAFLDSLGKAMGTTGEGLAGRIFDSRIFGDEGVSIAAQGGKAALKMYQSPGGAIKALVNLTAESNVSSWMHEATHAAIIAAQNVRDTDQGAKSFLDELEGILGVQNGDWFGESDAFTSEYKGARNHHEALTYALEDYFYTGKTARPEMQNLFKRIAQWLADLYRAITGARVQVSPELEAFFDRTFNNPESPLYQYATKDAPRPAQQAPTRSAAADLAGVPNAEQRAAQVEENKKRLEEEEARKLEDAKRAAGPKEKTNTPQEGEPTDDFDIFQGREDPEAKLPRMVREERQAVRASTIEDKLFMGQDKKTTELKNLGDAALAEVRAQYEGSDKWMKAPNGNATNLTETQWLQVRTPAFKEWFGDWENDPENASKVVDNNGEPLPVYHGTVNEGIERFKSGRVGGIYFTPQKEYAQGYGANLYEAFLRVEKLADLTDPDSEAHRLMVETFNENGGWEATDDAWEYMQDEGETDPLYNPERDTDTWELFDQPDTGVADAIEGAGYDGIKLIEREEGRIESIAVFSPNQIKSATDNAGTFLQDDPSILFQGEKTLAAIHNTGRLAEIEAFGGLPMPSLAILKPGNDFVGFGDATLILKPEKALKYIDWGQTFDRDIWSPTVPRAEYKLNKKVMTAFDMKLLKIHKTYSAAQRRGIQVYYSDRYNSSDVETPSYIERIADNDSTRITFLNETGPRVDIKMIEREHQENADPIVDRASLSAEINKRMEGRDEEYRAWIHDNLKDAWSEPFIKIGKERKPYNAETVYEYMRRQATIGSQKAITFGPSKAAASAARAFSSREDMKGREDRLASEQEVEKAIAALEPMHEEYQKLASKYRYNDTWAGLDAVYEAQAKYLKGGIAKRSPARMRSALSRAGIDGATDAEIEQALDLAHAIVDTPRAYFEAKPTDILGLGDFAAAVIPEKETGKGVADLEKHGVKIYRYKTEAERTARVKEASEEQGLLFQRAWHGTPHRFDAFTTDAIGTGEGVQAYGWGLYFAGDKEVAEWYARELATTLEIDGKPFYHKGHKIGTTGNEEADDYLLSNFFYPEEAIKNIEADIEEIKNAGVGPEQYADLEEARDLLKELVNKGRIGKSEAGHLYEVEIPDDEDFLDWDKRYEQQSEKVKEALKNTGLEINEPKIMATESGKTFYIIGAGGWEPAGAPRFRTKEKAEAWLEKNREEYSISTTGQQIYKKISSDPRDASRTLKKMGIPGIRYLDGNSRGSGKESYNYVVFADEDVDIVDTLYQGDEARTKYPAPIVDLQKRIYALAVEKNTLDKMARTQSEDISEARRARAGVAFTEKAIADLEKDAAKEENKPFTNHMMGNAETMRASLEKDKAIAAKLPSLEAALAITEERIAEIDRQGRARTLELEALEQRWENGDPLVEVEKPKARPYQDGDQGTLFQGGEIAAIDDDLARLYQGRDVRNVVYSFPKELKAYSDIHSASQLGNVLNTFGRGVLDAATGEIRLGSVGSSHAGMITGMKDPRRFYFGISRAKEAVYIVAKNGMDEDRFKKREFLMPALSQIFDQYRLQVAQGQRLAFHDTLYMGMDQLRGTDDPSMAAIKEHARTCESWEQFAGDFENPLFDLPQAPDLPEAEKRRWYRETWEAANRAAESEGDIDGWLASLEENDHAKLDTFLKGIWEEVISGETYNFMPSDQEELETVTRKRDLADRVQSEIAESVKAGALRVGAKGKALSDRYTQTILGTIRANPESYARIYGEIFDIAELAQIAAAKLEQKYANIEDPNLKTRRLSISQKTALVKAIQNEELGRKIMTGKIASDEVKEYIKYVRGEVKKGQDQIKVLEDEINDDRRIMTAHEKRWVEASKTLADLDHEIVKHHKRINAILKEGKGIPPALEAEEKRLAKYKETLERQRDRAASKIDEPAKYLSKLAKIEEGARIKATVQARQIEQRALKKAKEYQDSLVKAIMKKAGSTVNLEQARAIKAIQDTIDPKRRTASTQEKIDELRAELAANPELAKELPREWINRAAKKNLGELTLAELEEAAQTVKNLRRQGRMVYDQKKAERDREVRTWQDDLLDTITHLPHAKKPGEALDESIVAKFMQKIQSADYAFTRPQQFIELLDGKTNGRLYELLVKERDRLYREELAGRNRRIDNLKAAFAEEGVKPESWHDTTVTLKGMGPSNTDITLTKSDMAALELAFRNEQSRAAALYGNFFSHIERQQMTDDDLYLEGGRKFTVIRDAIDDTLTDADKRVVERIAADGDETGARLVDVVGRVENRAVETVDNYFPIKRLGVVGEAIDKQIAGDITSRLGGLKKPPRNGFTKSRVEINPRYQTAIRLDLYSTWIRSIKEQEHYIATAEYGKKLDAILTNNLMQEAVKAASGDAGVKYLKDYVAEIKNPGELRNLQKWEESVRWLRGNLGVGYLAMKSSSVLKQLITSPWPALAYSGPHFFGNLFKAMANPVGFMRQQEETSAILKSRSMDPIMDAIKNAQAKTKAERGFKRINEIGMKGLELVDRYCVAIGWRAMYDKARADGLDIPQAIEKADDLTIKTQPTSREIDLAPVYRDQSKPMAILLQFTSQLNVIWNNVRRDIPMALREHEYGKAVGIITSYIIAGVLMNLMTDGLGGDDGEDPEAKEIAGRLALYSSSQFIEAMPFIGSYVTEAIRPLLTDEKGYNFPDTTLPGVDLFFEGITTIANNPDNWGRGLAQFSQGLGLMAGAPVSGIKEAARVASGDVGALFGRRKKKE